MKKLVLFLLIFLCVPIICRAEMVGSVDKRRYVTEQEKQQFPYNAVVRFEKDGGPATGTFVSPNVILTCRHCVDDVGNYGDIDFYTVDGQKHVGRVWIPILKGGHDTDYAFVRSWDYAFKGEVPNSVFKTVNSGTVNRSGYEALKVLTDTELSIVKNVIAENLSQQTGEKRNIYEDMGILAAELLVNHACESETDKDCVHCSENPDDWCIFGDNDNLKTQDECSVTNQENGILITNCAGFPGASGSALISNDDNNIRGVIVTLSGGLEIGTNKDPEVKAVKPEKYYNKLNLFINEMSRISAEE